MSAIKFETFALGAEDAEIERVSQEEVLAKTRDEAYAKGFKDGVNVTNEAIETAESEVATAVQEALADADLTQRAAIHRALADVAKLTEAFCCAIAPNLAKSGLAAEIAALFETVLNEDPDDVLVISHSSADYDILQRLLGKHDLTAELNSDPTLSPRQVTLNWDSGFDKVDMDEAVAKALMKITNFTQLVDKEEPDERYDAVGE